MTMTVDYEAIWWIMATAAAFSIIRKVNLMKEGIAMSLGILIYDAAKYLILSVLLISIVCASQSLAGPTITGWTDEKGHYVDAFDTFVTGTITNIELTQHTIHGFNGRFVEISIITFDDGTTVRWEHWPQIPVKVGNKYKFRVRQGNLMGTQAME